jgi:hypothetical protein
VVVLSDVARHGEVAGEMRLGNVETAVIGTAAIDRATVPSTSWPPQG